MTKVEYEQWWNFHLRVARGEMLSDEEAVIYQRGLEKLDSEEATTLQSASLDALRQLRSQIQQKMDHLTQLTRRNEQLTQQIAELEQTYQQLTGYSLVMETHVSSEI